MKIIKVMISASEEMREEQIQFQTLLNELNLVLNTQGIELRRIKQDPEVNWSMDNYKQRLKDCEIYLTLYWQKLATNAQEEFDIARHELEDGNNPNHLYIFFKEPADDLTAALKKFKNSIEKKYNHFFCRFENVDTMNLHFVLKILRMQNPLQDKQNPLITIGDGKVKIGDKVSIHLDNIPFAALNKEYQRLRQVLTEIDIKINAIEEQYKANPLDEKIKEQRYSLLQKRESIEKEFKKCQQNLFDKALFFARIDREYYSERIQRAKEAFERGDAIAADEILDETEIDSENERHREMRDQSNEDLKHDIQVRHLKTKTVMDNTNLPISARFDSACKQYTIAIADAKTIPNYEAKVAELLSDYADLLSDFNKLSEAESIYIEATEIYRRLAVLHPNEYEMSYAKSLNNLSLIQRLRGQFIEARNSLTTCLEIYNRLASQNIEQCDYYRATALDHLATILCNLQEYDSAESMFKEAVAIAQNLLKDSVNDNSLKLFVAERINNLAAFQHDTHHLQESICNSHKAFDIIRAIANDDPKKYDPELALILNNIGLCHLDLQQFKEAETYLVEALEITRRLVQTNAFAYELDLARLSINYGQILEQQHKDKEAEKKYVDALEIFRRWSKIDPDAYDSYVALTLTNLAKLKEDYRLYEDAENNYDTALQIYRRLVQNNSLAHELKLAIILLDYGICKRKHGSDSADPDCYVDAQEYCEEALKIITNIVQRNPDAHEVELAIMMNDLGQMLSDFDKTDEAIDLLHKALNLYNNWNETLREANVKLKIMILMNLALIEESYDEQDNYFQESLSLCRLYVSKQPAIYKPILAKILLNIGHFHNYHYDFTDAKSSYSEALTLYKQLEEENPGKYSPYIEELESYYDDTDN